MKFVATSAYTLIKDKNLSPGRGVLPTGANPIKAIHCIVQPLTTVTIRLSSGQVVKFPSTAFVQGAIYPYEITQINEEGARCFIGISN